MNGVEKLILEYLENRDGKWEMVMGSEILDKNALISKFKKDKKFRKKIVKAVNKLAVEMFLNHNVNTNLDEK